MECQVKVLIPIYRIEFTPQEQISIARIFALFGGKYPIVWVKPQQLDVSDLDVEFGVAEVESFPNHYFTSLHAYNVLMLSPQFYARFKGIEFVLICQPDVYVFSDQLAYWCAQGYDYVGAPWLPKKYYSRFYYVLFKGLRRWMNHLCGKTDRSALYYRVGNGGFSLRRVESHHQVTLTREKDICYYLDYCRKNSLYNEDVFWAFVFQEKGTRGQSSSEQNPPYRVPGWREALTFAFDVQPAYAFELNNRQLPFACHGWTKPSMYHFWKEFIPASVSLEHPVTESVGSAAPTV